MLLFRVGQRVWITDNRSPWFGRQGTVVEVGLPEGRGRIQMDGTPPGGESGNILKLHPWEVEEVQ